MSLRSWLVPALCASVGFGVSSASGSVIVVDQAAQVPFDFTDIGAAVAAAVDGDIVLVRDGTYDQFAVVGKSLTILGDTSASVVVGATPNDGLPAISIDATGAPANVTVRGFALVGPSGSAATTNAVSITNGASAMLEEISADGFSVVVVVDGSSLVAHACEFYGAVGDPAVQPIGGTAIVANGSWLALHDTTVVGGAGADATSLIALAGTGGVGMTLSGSNLVATGTFIAGGQGGGGIDFGGPCAGGGDGGAGLVLDVLDPFADLIGSTVEGGPAGFGTGACFGGQDGVPFVVNSGTLTGAAALGRSYFIQSPVREGQSVTMKFSGEPGDQRFMFYGGSFASITAPSFYGALHVGIPLNVVALPAMVAPSESFTFFLPVLPPGLDGVTIYTQPAHVDLVGNAHLHSPSVLVILDASF